MYRPKGIFQLIKQYQVSESGQGMSEYLVLVLLIAVGSIAASKSIGTTIYQKLEQVHRSLETVTIESVHGSSGTNGSKAAPGGSEGS